MLNSSRTHWSSDELSRDYYLRDSQYSLRLLNISDAFLNLLNAFLNHSDAFLNLPDARRTHRVLIGAI